MRKMTEGGITGHLLACALPMILGNILQLTYNAADSIIIGKCLGENALAAVSVANPVMTIVVLGVFGLSIGASVLMSRFYGADELDKLKREFSSTLIFGAAFSLIVFVLGLLFSGALIRLMDVPAAAGAMAERYLRIVFVGFLFTFQYNIISAALRSIGDARAPVAFLGASVLLNIALDLLLVRGLDMGVAGAAIATVISQALSALLCVVYVYRRVPCLRLGRGDFVVDKALLIETLKSGSLTALQQSSQPIGKVLIQRVINGRGVAAIAAFNAVCRMDDFACIPAQSIGHSIMTCVAQNRGAGRPDRVRETFRRGFGLAILYFPLICGAALIFREPFMRLLSPDGSEEIVAMGVGYLCVKAWFYIFPCTNNAVQGYFRGQGRMKITLIATLIQIGLRTLVVSLLVPKMGIVGEAYACLIGWICMAAYEYGLYFLERAQAKRQTVRLKKT